MSEKRPFPIYAKSAFDKVQLAARLKAGCAGIEYQMRKEDFQDGSGDLVHRKTICTLLDHYPAAAIHVAGEQANIEDDSPLFWTQLETAMELAEVSALKKERRIPVIVHIESNVDQISAKRLFLLDSQFDGLFNRYPHVDLAIENTTPFRHFQNGSSVLSSGYYDAPVKFIQRFERYAKTGRLGVCLDICHARITDWYFEILFERYGDKVFDTSLKAYFDMYAPYLRIIHLASFDHNGYGLGNHATPIGEQPQDLVHLDEFLDLYKDYFPDKRVPVTLEINERDVNDPQGYIKSKDMVISVSALNA